MAEKHKRSISYRDAGVDTAAADSLIRAIKPLCEKTARPGVIANPGGFAGLFELPLSDYRCPVMLAATDGVGTKLRLAGSLGRYDTIGVDLVAMCVNDILTHGGEPVAFLDYYACGKLDVEQAHDIIKGIAEGCRQAGAGLLGGETAEMPGSYPPGEFDLAGFAVGLAEKDALLPTGEIAPGDAVIGIASSGVHANGFSLIHRIIKAGKAPLSGAFGASTLGETLLTPTTIYVRPLLPLVKQKRIRALAHITGGGITDNLARVLPRNRRAQINPQSWRRPQIFGWIQRHAGINDAEMLKVFNCGIGMCAIVAGDECDAVLAHCKKHKLGAWPIGEIRPDEQGTPRVTYS